MKHEKDWNKNQKNWNKHQKHWKKHQIIWKSHPIIQKKQPVPAPKGNNIKGLHVGAMVKQALLDKRVTHAVLGRRLARNQSMIKDLVARSSLQTYLVWELSVALEHNFFTDLAQQLDAATKGKLHQQQTELQQLKNEYAQLQEDHNLLKKTLDLLTKK